MAKNSMKTSYTKACITKDEEDNYIITETIKDDTKVFSLTDTLEQFLGVEGITLSIGSDSELTTIE